MLNLSQCDHTWSSLQNDGDQASVCVEWMCVYVYVWERERERENCKKKMERKGAGRLRRYFQFDLWSKPLMPAYSLAWKRIPKRYLNFPNAPRKRAKRRTILPPPLGEYFFPPLTKSWQWLSIAKRITSWWKIRRRYMSCLFRRKKGTDIPVRFYISIINSSRKKVTAKTFGILKLIEINVYLNLQF